MILALLLASFSGTASAQEAGSEDGAAKVQATASSTAAAVTEAPAKEKEVTWEMTVNDNVDTYIKTPIAKIFFFDLVFWDNDSPTNISLPIVVIWLIIGAVFFTIRMGFINIRGFRHAIEIVRGKYDNPDDIGEVTHFQALTAALSATVGLGNIGGVALAITAGGPGATFWMILAGFLGMASKFTECTLGQKYREVSPEGVVSGGPMQYLSKGLAEINYPMLGKVLAVFFAILCIGGSFAGGNAYQVNQSLEAIATKVTFLQDNGWVYGLIMTALAGVVIIGGIKRIATIAETIVPMMCGIYVAACLYILLANVGDVPAAFGEIIGGAFTLKAGFGGLLGVLIVGFTRSAFSNEAGVGSAAIAHSAAKSEYPVQEGIVALLEPFVDTIIVCTMSALVIVITGAYANPEWSELSGAGLTANAFGSEISWFPWILAVAVALFAYSTMISWYYYGERCWTWLFGDNATNVFRVIFLAFSFLGSVLTGKVVMDLGDLMILGMAFPNILGVLMLSGLVRKDLDTYWKKLKSGEIKARA
jgi:AGCS family alanine or glycine:cation symporter